ncbi:MAG: RNA polymerase sigma factor [Bacteroidota bacterium]
MLDGCKAGNRRAQSQLYRAYASVMLGVCMRYASGLAEAEDMLQEGFVKIFTNIASFRGSGSLEGWMRRIIINTALNHIRNKAKFRAVDYTDDLPDFQDEDSKEEEPITDVSAAILLQIIQNLPEGYRMVFNLFAIELNTHKEIADMLGISEGTSKSQLSKARRILKMKLAEVHNNSTLSVH